MSIIDKLKIIVDLFSEKREGIIMTPRTITFAAGIDPGSQNIGKTKSHGIEVELNWRDKISHDWRYSAGLNISASENRIVYRDDPKDFPAYKKDAGKPIGWVSRYIAAGNYYSIDDVFNAAQSTLTTQNKVIPGDFVYIDYNGDGIINSEDQVVSDKLNYPLTTYTLNLGISYKTLSLSAMFYSAQNVYKTWFPQLYYDFPSGVMKAQPFAADERWTWDRRNTSGVVHSVAHLLDGRAHDDTENTHRYVNYSYIRLKTLELSYKFPDKWLAKSKISNLQVYANGNNLFTITNVDKRTDPETGGIDSYPIVKTYTLGVRISF